MSIQFKKELPPFDPFQKIGGDWALLGVCDGERCNAMTVSWGECGVLWNKNVFTVFVRPERYSHELIENTDTVTLSFFDKKFRDTLVYFGRTSGRSEDKLLKSGLRTKAENGALVFEEAELVLVGKIIYKGEVLPENFVDKTLLSHYKDGGLHTAYTCEIIGCFTAEEN